MQRMPRCPHCNGVIKLEMFFTTKKAFLGTVSQFTGPTMHIGYKNHVKMWVCPHCDRVLGFSEYKWEDD